MTALHVVRGANFWSRGPVVRVDLALGAYEEISSADVPGFTEALLRVMPGLVEHQCSIGERGGFVIRLRRGTYAAHIVEHVALELQSMIGHRVGFGRTRGSEAPGTYTLVFEYLHEQVALRVATVALEVVQRAFAGTLDSLAPELEELRAIAEYPGTLRIERRILCGITGGSGRAEAASLLAGRLQHRSRCRAQRLSQAADNVTANDILDLSPASLLQDGLPYSRSALAVILDTELTDVPARYRESENARRLVAVVADGVERHGFVICPVREWRLQDQLREQGRRVAVFTEDDQLKDCDLECASATGRVERGRIVCEHGGEAEDAGPLTPDTPAAPQVAAALAAFLIGEKSGDGAVAD